MKNRNLQIGTNFLQKSLYDITSLQYGKQEWHPKEQIPSPFKIYQKTERYPLHQMPPLTLGDPRGSFYRTAEEEEDSRKKEGKLLTYESLSTLLYYTYGFSRHDEGTEVSWRFHRFVPSARCFFPTELYLWLPQTEHIPTGIYHYDNLHHSLALIREGEYRDLFAAAVDTDLNNCLGVLLISAHFWKNAFKYINFSYRLCTQEAGFVISNALIVADTLGYSGCIHYQFLDQPLNRLLGFVPAEESLLTIVPLYARNTQSKQPLRHLGTKTTQQPSSQTITPITLDYVKTTTFDHQLCSLLTEIDQHTFLADTAEIITETTVPNTPCLRTEERISPPTPLPDVRDLAEALHFRSSGDMNFLPMCVPLSQEAFWECVRYSLIPYHSDLQYPPAPPRLQIYIVIQHLQGMQAGIYRLCTDCGTLHVIERRNISMQIQGAQMIPNIISAPANLVCYLVGDYSAASKIYGNRAYRILNLEAGLIAQRICVMSAAQGLTARYSNSYNQALCKALLKLSDTPIEPLAELVIGYERPGVQAGSSYRFSLLR